MYCWRKSADYFEPTRATPFALRNRLSLSTCAARYRQSSGVKQGCVLAPTLFSLMFSTMLTDAFRDCDAGVRIRHNARREVVQPETSAGRHKGEGDCNQGLSLCGRLCPQRQKQEIQLEIDRLSTACDNFGLSISTKKDWSDVSASSQQPISGTHHHSQRWETPGCWEFHLPWHHPLKQHNLQSQQCVWAAQEDILGEKRNSPCHLTQSLQSSSSHHPPVRLRDLDCLQTSRKAAEPLPTTMPLDTPQHPKEGQNLEHWCSAESQHAQHHYLHAKGPNQMGR